ncbi:hypothetical protein NPIL_409051 [Nephila pilipes]|uniref:Uncharacterized protein n=1 Tax=Nephila pilipes TaxID=299642 RepID=A0A8X6QNL1_NEPPI|nr:hypothetical protein NPIL_409051 [Nephila pilipes]
MDPGKNLVSSDLSLKHFLLKVPKKIKSNGQLQNTFPDLGPILVGPLDHSVERERRWSQPEAEEVAKKGLAA